MKKLLLAGSVLIVIVVLVFVVKARRETPQTAFSEAGSGMQAEQQQATQPVPPLSPVVEKAEPLMAIDAFVEKHPSGRGVAELRRISKAFKQRPDKPQQLAAIAAASIEDGSISKEETVVLKEAAALAERKHVAPKDVARLSEKHRRIAAPAPAAAAKPVSNAQASAKIDSYIKKHPTGRGVTPLKRLSKALKSRPDEVQPLAATVVQGLEDGSVSKDEAPMLEEAATLAEKEGLSPAEMAEFSRKYASGVGLSQKPQSAEVGGEKASERIPSFEGKRELIYTFHGAIQCKPKACVKVQVRANVTAGRWVEEREGGLNAQGEYSLQMPVMSMINEKVHWRVEANDKDMRSAELSGERVTTAEDKDVTLQNNLILTAQ